MLSSRKAVLLVTSIAAAFGSVLTLSLAAMVQFEWLSPGALRPCLGPVLALTGIAFVPSVVLLVEYAQAARGAEFNLLAEESLAISEFLDALRWCPPSLVFLALALVPVTVLLCFVSGMPHWSSPQPLTLQAGRSIMLFQAPFLLLALPIVISGYRVPGSFLGQLQSESQSGT
jgi:hypothetical protein